MYKELSDCHSDEELSSYAAKLRDVYGPYPDEVANLLTKRKIENYLNSKLYSGFTEALGAYVITMSDLFSSKTQIHKRMEEYLQPLVVKLKVRVNAQHRFELVLTKTKDYLGDLLFLTENLEKAYMY